MTAVVVWVHCPSHLLLESMRIPIGGLMGMVGNHCPLPFTRCTLNINGNPHGDADLQIFYSVDKSI